MIVGRFVRDHVAAGGRRTDLRLHTKLVPDLERLATYSAADVRAVVLRSCARLCTSYVDLVRAPRIQNHAALAVATCPTCSPQVQFHCA